MRLIFSIKIIAVTFLFSTICQGAVVKLPTDEKLISFLNKLFDYNIKYAESHDEDFFKKFHDTQTPHLTIVKCSDSRVSQDAFDPTPENDVFAIRNIGNQITTSEGSVDYGVKVLKTPYLIISGHSGCGAIKAANEKVKTNIPAIDKELSTIKLAHKQSFNDAIIENIHNQVELARKKYKIMVDSGELTILGVVYDFRNDFGLGAGKVILVNVNGIKNKELLNQTYNEKVKALQAM